MIELSISIDSILALNISHYIPLSYIYLSYISICYTLHLIVIFSTFDQQLLLPYSLCLFVRYPFDLDNPSYIILVSLREIIIIVIFLYFNFKYYYLRTICLSNKLYSNSIQLYLYYNLILTNVSYLCLVYLEYLPR